MLWCIFVWIDLDGKRCMSCDINLSWIYFKASPTSRICFARYIFVTSKFLGKPFIVVYESQTKEGYKFIWLPNNLILIRNWLRQHIRSWVQWGCTVLANMWRLKGCTHSDPWKFFVSNFILKLNRSKLEDLARDNLQLLQSSVKYQMGLSKLKKLGFWTRM